MSNSKQNTHQFASWIISKRAESGEDTEGGWCLFLPALLALPCRTVLCPLLPLDLEICKYQLFLNIIHNSPFAHSDSLTTYFPKTEDIPQQPPKRSIWAQVYLFAHQLYTGQGEYTGHRILFCVSEQQLPQQQHQQRIFVVANEKKKWLEPLGEQGSHRELATQKREVIKTELWMVSKIFLIMYEKH